MTLFSADLFRNFGFGFLAGAAILGASTIADWGPHLETPAQAATPLEAPSASSEFTIEPLEISQ
ncbi:MAG: hypothetical protein ABJN35_12065 [Erythrobacter sp.]|uniref:hypothetical protein n=1 Tax=Erythrobacter sp. Alg231-14 TaxID=1922225 RepID=UPI000D552F52